MSYDKFNLNLLENIVNTQYGDFGGLIQVDRSDSFDFYKLCTDKGIDMKKYFLVGVHFGTSSLKNVSKQNTIYCFVLLLETKKYGNSFDEISKYLEANDNKAEIQSFDFQVTFQELAKCVKRFHMGFVSPLSKHIDNFTIKENI